MDYAQFFPEHLQDGARLPGTSQWYRFREFNVHYVHRAVAVSPVTVVAVHGAGGHAGALWPFVAATGLDAAAIDLPLYGRTKLLSPGARGQVRYEDWVDLLVDFVDTWPRPVVLVGFSIGGILASEVAARTTNVLRTVATCLVECSDPAALTAINRLGMLGAAGPVFAPLARGPISRIPVPMRWVARMDRMSGNRALTRQCIRDPLSGQVSVPLGFLASLVRYRHHPHPEVILAHPARDAWTPLRLSTSHPHSRLVLLEGCGHFPVESPGVERLMSTIQGS